MTLNIKNNKKLNQHTQFVKLLCMLVFYNIEDYSALFFRFNQEKAITNTRATLSKNFISFHLKLILPYLIMVRSN